MEIDLLTALIKYLITVLAGILLGNGAVYLFNHMPAEWFCDYGEEPSEELKDPYTQRVKSTPWKYWFSMLFVAVGLYLVRSDILYAVSSLAVLWILVELSLSDVKYRIIPDQLLILLAVSSIGMIQFREGWKDMLYGAAAGFGIMLVVAALGKAFYRRDSVGGGDIKLFAALGLTLGLKGVIAAMMMTSLISAAHLTFLLATKKIKIKDTIPMVPYITTAAGLYMVFIFPHV